MSRKGMSPLRVVMLFNSKLHYPIAYSTIICRTACRVPDALVPVSMTV